METDRRSLLKGAGALMVAGLTVSAVAEQKADAKQDAPTFRIQRLSWAGIKIEYGQTTLLIDPLISDDIWDGASKMPVVPITVNTRRRHVLLTHLHNDHFDPAAIHSVEAETQFSVVCHENRAVAVSSRGFKVNPAKMFEPVTAGDLLVWPVPAVDGFNEFQVSWIVSAQGKRIIHCGDTLWHGAFWEYGRQFGPFDAAFVPINGARLYGYQPFSDVEATMTPQHAVAAGVVMGARLLVPIHYGLNDPGSYIEYSNPEKTFTTLAEARKQPYKVMGPGEWITL